MYVMIFIGMGLALFASQVGSCQPANLLQLIAGFTFSLAGARLVERVRRSMFNAMLNQEIGWFDKVPFLEDFYCNVCRKKTTQEHCVPDSL